MISRMAIQQKASEIEILLENVRTELTPLMATFQILLDDEEKYGKLVLNDLQAEKMKMCYSQIEKIAQIVSTSK